MNVAFQTTMFQWHVLQYGSWVLPHETAEQWDWWTYNFQFSTLHGFSTMPPFRLTFSTTFSGISVRSGGGAGVVFPVFWNLSTTRLKDIFDGISFLLLNGYRNSVALRSDSAKRRNAWPPIPPRHLCTANWPVWRCWHCTSLLMEPLTICRKKKCKD